jgi:hypothetical protein
MGFPKKILELIKMTKQVVDNKIFFQNSNHTGNYMPSDVIAVLITTSMLCLKVL